MQGTSVGPLILRVTESFTVDFKTTKSMEYEALYWSFSPFYPVGYGFFTAIPAEHFLNHPSVFISISFLVCLSRDPAISSLL